MAFLNYLDCCGVSEISEIAESTPSAVVNQAKGTNKGQFIFTGASPNLRAPLYSENLAAYITKHKLGEVKRQRPFRNTNSGNFVYTYVWNVNREAVKKHRTRR